MDRAERWLRNIAEANRQEWERLIEGNHDLRRDVRALQGRYGFPMQLMEFARWCDAEPEEEQRFQADLEALMKKHGIPEKWRSDLRTRIVFGNLIGPALSMGFPMGRWYFRGDKPYHELIIEHDTDVSNPIVADYIRHVQLRNDPPPRPTPMKDNPRRKDWRPVYEWYLRHPGVTMREIAEMLGYNENTVRRKLAEQGARMK